MWLVRISPVVYHLSGGMSVDGKVHLILDLGKKLFFMCELYFIKIITVNKMSFALMSRIVIF